MNEKCEIIRADQIRKGDSIEVVHQYPGVLWVVADVDVSHSPLEGPAGDRIICQVAQQGSARRRHSLVLETYVKVRRYGGHLNGIAG